MVLSRIPWRVPRPLDATKYWNKRYSRGGNSGEGSYGPYAAWKAAVVNSVVAKYQIRSILDFGCGDGNQIRNIDVARYTGLDVSTEAVKRCRRMYEMDRTKTFQTYRPGSYSGPACEMVMSLEVLMHIVDESEFLRTLTDIFAAASRVVVLHVPLFEYEPYRMGSHVRYRAIDPYLINFSRVFTEVDRIIYPQATFEERERGEILDMASDFVILERKTAAP